MSKAGVLLRQLQMQPAEIAERSGITEQRIREILGGDAVSMRELRSLSKALRLPLDAFATGIRPMDREEEIRVLFRRVGNLSGELDPTREYVARYVTAALDVLPHRDHLPEILSDLEPDDESFEEAGRIAGEFRARLTPGGVLDPIENLADLLDARAGVIVGRLVASRFEGASLIAGHYPFIFVSPRFAPRILFTLAHELGHLIVHHSKGKPALFERASEIGGARQLLREAFVDAFASALLMPQQGVALALRAVRQRWGLVDEAIGDLEILMVARFFGVSFDVAARRFEHLQLIPPGGAISLVDMLKQKYKSPEKRAEEAKLPPRGEIDVPVAGRTLLRAIDAKIEEGAISIGWAADNFGLSVSQLFAVRKSLQ